MALENINPFILFFIHSSDIYINPAYPNEVLFSNLLECKTNLFLKLLESQWDDFYLFIHHILPLLKLYSLSIHFAYFEQILSLPPSLSLSLSVFLSLSLPLLHFCLSFSHTLQATDCFSSFWSTLKTHSRWNFQPFYGKAQLQSFASVSVLNLFLHHFHHHG